MSEEGIEQRARAAAGRWARWRLGPSGFADLITKVEAEPLRYGRLITRYAVRTATWQEEPNSGRAGASGQPLALSRWTCGAPRPSSWRSALPTWRPAARAEAMAR